MIIERGGVYLANLDSVVGSEIAKTRPVTVVSNDVNNRLAATVTVIPISSQGLEKIYPFETRIPKGDANLPKDSKAKANQIRTIDKSRLVRHVGNLPPSSVEAIEIAVKIHLDLSD